MQWQDKQVWRLLVFLFSNCNPLQGCKVCFYVVTAFRSPSRLKGVGLRPILCHFTVSAITHLYIFECFYHCEWLCTVHTTSFPAIKEMGSSVAWLPFSCPCAKSYISEGPVQHVGLWTLLSCQKMQEKKNSQVTSVLGPLPRGNPSRADGDAGREHGLRFWDALQFFNHAAWTVANLAYANVRACASHGDLSWYLSAWIPAHHADMSVKLEAFVFHICICWCWQLSPAILELI